MINIPYCERKEGVEEGRGREREREWEGGREGGSGMECNGRNGREGVGGEGVGGKGVGGKGVGGIGFYVNIAAWYVCHTTFMRRDRHFSQRTIAMCML